MVVHDQLRARGPQEVLEVGFFRAGEVGAVADDVVEFESAVTMFWNRARAALPGPKPGAWWPIPTTMCGMSSGRDGSLLVSTPSSSSYAYFVLVMDVFPSSEWSSVPRAQKAASGSTETVSWGASLARRSPPIPRA